VDTVIGKETEVKGTVSSSGVIRIDGKLEGELAHKGDVLIGETGQVAASIKARNVAVGGSVTGNIEAAGKLELLQTARVVGDVKSGSLIISEGAIFRGRSEMTGPEDRSAKTPARQP
jgi:cytoskeletal protein CcmA (bactofilin family)